MGRDFSYKIVRKGVNPPCKDDFDDEDKYWKAYRRWRVDFEEIMLGNMVDGRNQWCGPVSYDDRNGYDKQEMIEAFNDYVKTIDWDDYDYNVRFTLRAFGQIISEMSEDDVVYISYG